MNNRLENKRVQTDAPDGLFCNFSDLGQEYGDRAQKLNWPIKIGTALVVLLGFIASDLSFLKIFLPGIVNTLEDSAEEFFRPVPMKIPLPAKDLYDITFCMQRDRIEGLVVGEDAFLYVTENGGISWTFVDATVDEDLNKVAFSKDCGNALIVGDGGTILRYTNSNIELLQSNAREQFYDIALSKDGAVAVAVGRNGVMRVSRDGGDTWDNPRAGFVDDLHAVAVTPDGQRIVAAGRHRTLSELTWNENQWTHTEIDVTDGKEQSDFEMVVFNDEGVVMAVGEDGLVWIIGSNGFETLQDTEDSQGKDFNAMAFNSDGSLAIAVGEDGLVRNFKQSGSGWLPSDPARLSGFTFNDIAFGRQNRAPAVAIGDHGTIFVRRRDSTGENWCELSSSTANDLTAVDIANGTAFVVGERAEESNQLTFLTLTLNGCETNVNPVMTELPLIGGVLADEGTSVSRQENDVALANPDIKYIGDLIADTLRSAVSIVVLIYIIHYLIGQVRYYTRLKAFYLARADVLRMVNPEKLPQSTDFDSFERNANMLTPKNIDFEPMSSRSLGREALRLGYQMLQQAGDRSKGDQRR